MTTGRLLVAVAAGFLSCSLRRHSLAADEEPKPPAGPPPAASRPKNEPPAAARPPAASPTPEQAADAVLAAWKANDRAAVAGFGAKDDPDPWLVADELLARGESEAAVAFVAGA